MTEERPPQASRPTRVVVRKPQNEDGSQLEQRTYDNVLTGPNGEMYVMSNRPPEEVFLFGLHLDPDAEFLQERQAHYVAPAERSITQTREDGLCIYCQLLLLPDAPQYATHQPSLQLLIDSNDRCQFYKVITSSLSQGCPDLKEMYNEGYPPLYDRGNRATRITIESERFDKHSQIVATSGDPKTSNFRGKPVVWTTNKLLGSLKYRRIWEDYYSPNRSKPISRLNVLKKWLVECNTKHPHCERISGNDAPQLPTRVLEILEDESGSFKIKLYVSNGEHAYYTALSHCWGSSGPLRTLKSNLEEHQQRIPYDDLPVTFQDAVLMSWYIGCHYLWIDSLCIIQDGNDDWEVEAAGMAAIYANAMLTFAATASPDGSGGCTFDYNGPFCIPLDDDTALIRFQDHLNLDSEDAPLNTRGWAFQEAVLSRRLVCFPEAQMLWKCSSKHESEDGLLYLSDASPNKSDIVWNFWACSRKIGGGEPSYTFWYRMMEMYSRRRLTFEKDKLAALAGIVKEFKDVVGDEPVVGLWQGDMLNGLLWRTAELTSRVDYPGVMPSWSWASVSGSVSWDDALPGPSGTSPQNQLEVISVKIDWVGPPMTSRVLDANLKVRGRLKRAKLFGKLAVEKSNSFHLHEIVDSAKESPQPSETEPQKETPTAPEVLGYCYLEQAQPVDSHVWCLEVYSVCRRPESDGPRNHIHTVLILIPANKNMSEFTRVGVGYMWLQSFRADGSMDTVVNETFKDVQQRTISII